MSLTTMPLKERISTMLHISTGQLPMENGYHSYTNSGTSPPCTPASVNTAVTDPLSSPNTITTSSVSVYAKSSPNTAASSRQNSTSEPSPEDAIASPKTGASRLASRLSTLPKRMLRHKHTSSQPGTLSAFPLPPAPANNNNGNGKGSTRPASQQASTSSSAPNKQGFNPRAPSWRGHKHTKSAMASQTVPKVAATPTVMAQPQPQRPLTYHQPTNQTPFLYAAQSELMAGPHPGQPYNPFEHRPSPEPKPQPKSATDCWDDDPPHVRRRLQNRHWEVLFGDFSWASASARRSRSTAVEKAKRQDWGNVSPQSRSPSCSDRGGVEEEGRDNFWMREGEGPRGRPRLRTPTWADKGNGYSPSPDVLQARELAEKLARVRMKR